MCRWSHLAAPYSWYCADDPRKASLRPGGSATTESVQRQATDTTATFGGTDAGARCCGLALEGSHRKVSFCRGESASREASAPLHGHPGNRTNERSHFFRSDKTFANRSLASFAVVRARLLTLRSSQSCTLWLRYLQFKASHFASFSVTSQRSIYARCIRALESKREEAMRSHEQDQRAKGVFIMVSSV